MANPKWLAVGLTLAAIAGGSSALAQTVCPLCEPDGYEKRITLVDINNIKNNFGMTSPPVNGDLNCDAGVDLADFNIAKNFFEMAPPPCPTPGLATPEPSSLLLAVATGGAALFARRR